MIDVLGLIPARGGSKRLPGKNIKELGGVPLVCRTILAAQKSELITKLVVSSDSHEVLDIAAITGVDLLRRPDFLADDEATSYAVILNALEHYPAKYVCLMQCTSPFTLVDDIDTTINLPLSCGGCAVTIDMGSVNREPNGAVYAAEVEWLEKALKRHHAPFDSRKDRGYAPMPHHRSIDIDTQEDWDEAEKIMAMVERSVDTTH